MDFLRGIRRYWWIAFLTPAIVLGILSIRNLTADFQTSFSASVLLPGDTEMPGSSERPELMILDDIGPVVSSQAFAEMVADAASMPVEDVDGHLEASRYSRIVTVTARDPFGNPVSGVTVVLAASGGGNTVTQPGLTNASGVATGTVSSTVAGVKTISATVGGVAITQTATVTVDPGVAAQLAFTVQPSTTPAGYQITPAVRANIFGLNALKIYPVPEDVLKMHVKRDKIALERAMYRAERHDPSFRTHGPKTRREFLNLKAWEA